MSGFYVGLVLLVLGSAFQSSRLYGYATMTLSASYVNASGQTVYCNGRLAWGAPNNIRWYRDTVSFPTGAAATNALVNAWSRWNAGAANINIATIADSTGVSLSDGKSSIWFSSTLVDAPARTYWAANSQCKMDVADIVFSTTAVPWTYLETAQHAPYNTSSRNFTGVAIHEFGHGLGLQHENRYYNMMGSDATHVTRGPNSVTFYGPGEDANSGTVLLYGQGTGRPDIGVTVMRYLTQFTLVPLEYSQHKFGTIRANGVAAQPCPTSTIQGQPCSSVRKGATYSMEATIENNGTSGTPPSIPIRMYLNSNINLTTRTLLRTNTVTASRDIPFETTLSFTVPSTARSATYYFVSAEYARPTGYADNNSRNNVGFIPIYVQ